MDLKKLLGMRPKTEGMADIEAALAAARGAGEAAASAEAALLAKRGDVLLTGTPEEVTRAEEALTRARTEAEHAATMVPILEAKLAAAMREKKIGELRVTIRTAHEKVAAATAAITTRYPELAAAMVREVLVPEGEALEAIRQARMAVEAAHRAGLIHWPDDAKPSAEWRVPKSPLEELYPASSHHRILGLALWQRVALPRPVTDAGEHLPVWPPEPVAVRQDLRADG